jgi:predicted RNase H-like HicB family nuclease
MKRELTSSIWKEGDWFVAQCIEVDVASQGATPELALANLKEALELHFEPPHATFFPESSVVAWAIEDI